jgi:hypothetical protein
MKRLKVKSWCLALLTTACCSPAWAGFPFSRSSAIEGHVVDALTGRPIGNVIVSIQWYGGDCWSIHGPSAKKLGAPLLVATDQNGHYRLPARTWLTPCGMEGVAFGFSHPFYVTAGETAVYEKGFQYLKEKYGKNGVLVYDVKLAPQDHVFKVSAKAADGTLLDFNYTYFIGSRLLGLDIDFKEVFGRWEEWLKKFPETRERALQSRAEAEKISQMTGAELKKAWRERWR